MQPRTVISDVQLECAVFTCTVCEVDRKPRVVISDAQPECQVHLHHVADTVHFLFFIVRAFAGTLTKLLFC